MKRTCTISLDPQNRPKVLLIGNGLLRLEGGISWDGLIARLDRRYDVTKEELEKLPSSMRPEAVCGVDAEQTRQATARAVQGVETPIAPELRQLLSLDFDCILTTNYTYEVERVLCGENWTEQLREKTRTALDGSLRAHRNTSICHLLERNGKPLPVWHIHGDAMHSQSLVLSYYDYMDLVFRLKEYNHRLANRITLEQQAGHPLAAHSWLDWFIVGDVYCVGFGMGLCEFDLWWALERKSREDADVGTFFYYREKPPEGVALMRVMRARIAPVHQPCQTTEEYRGFYRKVIGLIADELGQAASDGPSALAGAYCGT